MAHATWNSPAQAVGLFLRGHTLRTALPDGQATTGTWVRMLINYLVPFIVASIGYLGARRAPVRHREATLNWSELRHAAHHQDAGQSQN